MFHLLDIFINLSSKQDMSRSHLSGFQNSFWHYLIRKILVKIEKIKNWLIRRGQLIMLRVCILTWKLLRGSSWVVLQHTFMTFKLKTRSQKLEACCWNYLVKQVWIIKIVKNIYEESYDLDVFYKRYRIKLNSINYNKRAK